MTKLEDGSIGYSGWHSVCDHKHLLIAVCYEPVDGTLSCRFNSGTVVLHFGVPENLYQILLRSKFGGAYYRKHIMRKYRCENADGTVPKFQSASRAPQEKLAALAKKRLESVPEMEATLFGPMPVTNGACQPKRKRGTTSS